MTEHRFSKVYIDDNRQMHSLFIWHDQTWCIRSGITEIPPRYRGSRNVSGLGWRSRLALHSDHDWAYGSWSSPVEELSKHPPIWMDALLVVCVEHLERKNSQSTLPSHDVGEPDYPGLTRGV